MSGKIRSRISLIIIVICATALLMIVPAISAQEAHSVELIGVIEGLSLNTVTVNQQEVNISRAEVNTALTVGALVEIEGTLGSDGVISAREVNSVRLGVVAGEAELSGRVTSMRDTTLVISGQMIDITGAEIRGSLVVGEYVRIHASVVGPNMWRAREIEVLTGDDSAPAITDDEFEITGTLESIDGTMVTVAGQPISLIGAEINDPLVIGTRVKVHVSAVAGVLTAREIELADPDDDDDSDNGNTNDNSNSNSNDNDNENENENENENSNDNVQGVTVTLEQAISEVRRVYPNAQIRSVELTTRFGGTPVWEIEISGGIELVINAQTGVLLLIDQPGSDDNGNSNSNDNEDDGEDDSNSNANGNDNRDDDSNDNEDDGADNGNDNQDDDGEDDDNDNEDDDGEDDDNDND